MRCSKNIIKKYIIFGLIFLISCALFFFSAACNAQGNFLDYGNTTIPRNITCSSIPGNQQEASTPYFINGSIKCYCGHGSVFILSAAPDIDINNLESCVLEESIHSIMQSIDNICREYKKTASTGSSGDNTDTPDQDTASAENEQNTGSTDGTTDASQENQQVINTNDFIHSLLHLINTSRAQNGLPSLNLNPGVCNVASLRSQDMIDRNYFSHTTPEGKNIFNILQECGIAYGTAGENILYSYPLSNASPVQYFNTWMASNVHRANILGVNYSQIGIGISFNNSRVVAVLVFVG